MRFCSHSRQTSCVDAGFILLISLASLQLGGQAMEKNKRKRFHSKSWDFMGWLIQNNGSLCGDSLHCRLCTVREQHTA